MLAAAPPPSATPRPPPPRSLPASRRAQAAINQLAAENARCWAYLRHLHREVAEGAAARAPAWAAGGGAGADAWDVAWQAELIRTELARNVLEASEGSAFECGQLRREVAELQARVAELALQMRQQDWAVWAQRLQRLEQACVRQSEVAGATSHDVGVVVAELQHLAKQQEGAAEVTGQLRELTTLLYKSWATVQQIAADKAHAASLPAAAGKRRADAGSAATRPYAGEFDA